MAVERRGSNTEAHIYAWLEDRILNGTVEEVRFRFHDSRWEGVTQDGNVNNGSP